MMEGEPNFEVQDDSESKEKLVKDKLEELKQARINLAMNHAGKHDTAENFKEVDRLISELHELGFDEDSEVER